MAFLDESTINQLQMANLAHQQKQIALDMINTLTYEIVDELKTIPRALPVVARVLESNAASLEKLYALYPATKESLREKYTNLIKMGDTWSLTGKIQKAKQIYMKAMAISKRLADDDPQNIRVQLYMSISYNRIGNVQQQLGNTQAALNAYEQAMAIRKQLAADDDPQNMQAQRDLASSYRKIGRIDEFLSNNDKALKAYQKAMIIMEKLAKNSHNRLAQDELALLRRLIKQLEEK